MKLRGELMTSHRKMTWYRETVVIAAGVTVAFTLRITPAVMREGKSMKWSCPLWDVMPETIQINAIFARSRKRFIFASICLSKVKWGLQPRRLGAPAGNWSTRLAAALFLSLEEWETTLAWSEWVCLFYQKALANERTNSCWAGCLWQGPTPRLTAPSAGRRGSCFSFVSCQVTQPTQGCVQCCAI